MFKSTKLVRCKVGIEIKVANTSAVKSYHKIHGGLKELPFCRAQVGTSYRYLLYQTEDPKPGHTPNIPPYFLLIGKQC